jgi:hypothetical protein
MRQEDIEFEILNNRRQFVKELKGVISSEKILLLKKLEADFKNKLLQQFKDRKGEN